MRTDWDEIEELTEDVADILDLLKARQKGRSAAKEADQNVTIRQLRNELQYNKDLKLLLKGKEAVNGFLDRMTLSSTIETLGWARDSIIDFDHLFTLGRTLKLHQRTVALAERIFNALDVQQISMVDRDAQLRLLLTVPQVAKFVRDSNGLLNPFLQPSIVRAVYENMIKEEGINTNEDVEPPEFTRLAVLVARLCPEMHSVCDIERNKQVIKDFKSGNTKPKNEGSKIENKLHQRTNEQAESLVDNGRYALLCGNFKQAIILLREATHADAENKSYRLAVAEALMYDGKFTKAQVEMEICLERNPFWVPAREMWIRAEENKSKGKKAKEAKLLRLQEESQSRY